MSSIIITSFFTKNGVPQTGLTPTIRIWEVSGGAHQLLVGTPDGSTLNTDGTMTEIFGTAGDGFYKFEFTDVMGFNSNKTFVARSNGGTTLPLGERYQVIGMNPAEALDTEAISNSVWDSVATSHNISGTFGGKFNIIASDTHQVAIDMITVKSLLDLMLKYETNRTKIDPVNYTLTVFDDDCNTPLRVFRLLDSTGTPSVDSVCERRPISATDGEPICP